MTEKTVEPQIITVDDVQYDLADFSEGVQRLVAIHKVWEAKVPEAKLEVARAEAAVRDLTRELIDLIKVELAEKETPAE